MVQVCGTKAEAYFMTGRGTYVRLHDKSNISAISKYGEQVLTGFIKVESGTYNGHDRCIAEWVKSLRGEEANIITSGRECRKTVEVAEASYRSAEEKKLITLPIEPKEWQ
jgi:predicted dehydrogenase